MNQGCSFRVNLNNERRVPIKSALGGDGEGGGMGRKRGDASTLTYIVLLVKSLSKKTKGAVLQVLILWGCFILRHIISRKEGREERKNEERKERWKERLVQISWLYTLALHTNSLLLSLISLLTYFYHLFLRSMFMAKKKNHTEVTGHQVYFLQRALGFCVIYHVYAFLSLLLVGVVGSFNVAVRFPLKQIRLQCDYYFAGN